MHIREEARVVEYVCMCVCVCIYVYYSYNLFCFAQMHIREEARVVELASAFSSGDTVYLYAYAFARVFLYTNKTKYIFYVYTPCTFTRTHSQESLNIHNIHNIQIIRKYTCV
jgi:hypothetical protein